MDEQAEPQVRVVDRRWWARAQENDSAAPAESSVKPTYVEDLEKRLADVTEQVQAALLDRRRAQDEFEQVKARLRRDTARETERGQRALLLEFLDVMDNLDRALTACAPEQANEGLGRGVSLVRDQFLAKLASFGVQRVTALGALFDAESHEAITTASVDADQDGLVVAVIREGYAIGDDILRPASVVVGRKAE